MAAALGVATAVVVIAIALFVVDTDDDGSATETVPSSSPVTISETQPVEVDGDALPTFPVFGIDPAVGKRAPVLRGHAFDGSPVSLERGRPMLVAVMSHWCVDNLVLDADGSVLERFDAVLDLGLLYTEIPLALDSG